MSSSNLEKVVQNLPAGNIANNRLSIPPNATLPIGWSADPATLHREFDADFKPGYYGLPKATPIAVSRNDLEYLMDCESRYLIFNGISDVLLRIDHPTELGDILGAMTVDGLRTTELDELPIASDYADTRGWSFDAEVLQTLLKQVDFQKLGFSHIIPVTGLRDDKVLLFWHGWENHLWQKGTLRRVDEPTKLYEIVSILIKEGFSSSSTLKTTLVHIA